MKDKYKPNIIQVSFKTSDNDDKFLYDWLMDRVQEAGGNKSAYIKSVLRKEMISEINKN